MELFDQFGREIIPESRPDENILAYTNLQDNFDDFPSKGLTPKKLSSIFLEANQGNPLRQMELFEEMEEKDTHLFSILSKRRGAVSGLNYEIVPFSQEKKDLEISDFINDAVTSLPNLEESFKDIVDAIGKGYSALELFWEIKDGKNYVRHLDWVNSNRLIWKDRISPRLLTKEEPYDGIELSPFKFILHIHKTKSGHPARQGLMRICAWMYLFKNFDIKSWVKFAEGFGIPLRLGKYDSGAKTEDKQALIKAIRALGTDAAGIISKGTEIELIEAAVSGNADFFEKLAKFCNAEMSKAVLGQTMTTEQGDKGARSLGEVHQDTEYDIKKDDCEQISKSIRRDLIRPLVGFNFGWDASLPWFKFNYEKPEDLTPEAERYETHLRSGVKISAKHYREKFNLPEPEEGDEIIEYQGGNNGAIQNENPLPAKNNPKRTLTFRRLPSSIPGDDEDHVGSFLERAMAKAKHDPMVDPVLKLLNESKDLEEFQSNLHLAFKDMEVTELANLMQDSLELAELTGRFEALPPATKRGANKGKKDEVG